MDFDWTWILLAAPAAFALGWLASRFDVRQMRIERQHSPKAYFKGLNYLLNGQQDQAVDVFIEAVQNDPDTAELHFALGNLFRRRGEYDRAVRVHEHLLARADLSQNDRERAQNALAQDFLKAGLLDRAEVALRRLAGTSFEPQALLALLAIYERSRDWPQAIGVAQKLEALGQGSFATRRAHYLCEQAQDARSKASSSKKMRTTSDAPDQSAEALGEALQAVQALLRQAIDLSPQAPRAHLMLADCVLHQADASQDTEGQNGANAAWDQLIVMLDTLPSATPMIAPLLVRAAQPLQRQAEALAILQSIQERSVSLDVLSALVELDPEHAKEHYNAYLASEPSLVATASSLKLMNAASADAAPGIASRLGLHMSAAQQRALDHAAKPLQRYRCAACGFETQRHFWQCPGCQAWDSYPYRRVEEL
jgi:lipopolysaccharide assembly protein B